MDSYFLISKLSTSCERQYLMLKKVNKIIIMIQQFHLPWWDPFFLFSIIYPIEQYFSNKGKNCFAFRIILYCFRTHIPKKKKEKEIFKHAFKFWDKFNAVLAESKNTIFPSDDWKWDNFMGIGSSLKVVDTIDI